MEDIQLIIYIVFLVFYLIFKALQKKKKPPTRNPEQSEQTPERKRKPTMTFEEMLKEFTGESSTPEEKKEEREADQERKTIDKKTIDKRYEEPVRKEEKQTEYFTYEKESDDQARQVYEDSVKHGGKAQTIDEKIDLENLEVGNVVLVIDEEEEKEKTELTTNEYLQMFSNTNSAKKAFVASEIFNRKYK